MTDLYASGTSWHTVTEKPSGGFVFLHEHAVHRIWAALSNGGIGLRDVRVWLACHELLARRCTLESKRTPRFTLEELKGLVGGVGGEHIRKSVNALRRHNLIEFTEHAIDVTPGLARGARGRMVPCPRPMLRHLCAVRGRAYLATALAHLLRCSFYRAGKCRFGGWCKASWVAESFGVAIRAVKEARTRLVSLGFLLLAKADQLRLNRFGCPVLINAFWRSSSAPPDRQSTTESAPLRKHKNLSLRRVEHQKPARAAVPAGARTRAKDPDLNNVTLEDLKDPWRLAALFKQARLRGWVRKTESDILAFFGIAVKALRVGSSNPPGLFRWLLHERRFEFASLHDEDGARSLIHQLRHPHLNLSSVEQRFGTTA